MLKVRSERNEDERSQRLRARIEEANAEICNRPEVPMPPAMRRSVFFDTRGSPKTNTENSPEKPISREDAVCKDSDGLLHKTQEADTAVVKRDEAWLQRLDKIGLRETANDEDEDTSRRRLRAMGMTAGVDETKKETAPRRRHSVGPGSRRHRVHYNDGLYRWE